MQEKQRKREEMDSRKSPLRDCMGWMCYLCGDAVDVLLLDPQRSYTPFIYLASIAQRHGNLINALSSQRLRRADSLALQKTDNEMEERERAAQVKSAFTSRVEGVGE